MKTTTNDLVMQTELNFITESYKEFISNLTGIKFYSKSSLIVLEAIRLIHQDKTLLYNLFNGLYPKISTTWDTTVFYVDRAVRIQSEKILSLKENTDFISSVSPIYPIISLKRNYRQQIKLTNSEFLSLFYELITYELKTDAQKRITLLLNAFSIPSNCRGYYFLSYALELLENSPNTNNNFTIEELYCSVSNDLGFTRDIVESNIRSLIKNYQFSESYLNFCNNEYQTNFSVPSDLASESLTSKKFIILLYRILNKQ